MCVMVSRQNCLLVGVIMFMLLVRVLRYSCFCLVLFFHILFMFWGRVVVF
jgi:hypothetical protein